MFHVMFPPETAVSAAAHSCLQPDPVAPGWHYRATRSGIAATVTSLNIPTTIKLALIFIFATLLKLNLPNYLQNDSAAIKAMNAMLRASVLCNE
jgi:hypothetical protein